MTLHLGLLLTATAFILGGCYEPASTWSEKQGRYRPTDEVRREIINDEIDKRKFAECSWKEIERDGDWQQTCDDNQKRLQR